MANFWKEISIAVIVVFVCVQAQNMTTEVTTMAAGMTTPSMPTTMSTNSTTPSPVTTTAAAGGVLANLLFVNIVNILVITFLSL